MYSVFHTRTTTTINCRSPPSARKTLSNGFGGGGASPTAAASQANSLSPQHAPATAAAAARNRSRSPTPAALAAAGVVSKQTTVAANSTAAPNDAQVKSARTLHISFVHFYRREWSVSCRRRGIDLAGCRVGCTHFHLCSGAIIGYYGAGFVEILWAEREKERKRKNNRKPQKNTKKKKKTKKQQKSQ